MKRNANNIAVATSLEELTLKGASFAGKSIKTGEKGPVKDRRYIGIPFSEFNGAEFAKYANLDLETLKTEFAIMLKGKGGRTSDGPEEAFSAATAYFATVPARINTIRAKLGTSGKPLTDAQFGELMARFKGSHVQALLAVINRYDVMTGAGSRVTFETLAPKNDDARAKVSK